MRIIETIEGDSPDTPDAAATPDPTPTKKMPTKPCPTCGAALHPAKRKCDCGHEFALKTKKAVAAPQPASASAKRDSTPAPAKASEDDLLEFLTAVQAVGGIEKAQRILDVVAKLK